MYFCVSRCRQRYSVHTLYASPVQARSHQCHPVLVEATDTRPNQRFLFFVLPSQPFYHLGANLFIIPKFPLSVRERGKKWFNQKGSSPLCLSVGRGVPECILLFSFLFFHLTRFRKSNR